MTRPTDPATNLPTKSIEPTTRPGIKPWPRLFLHGRDRYANDWAEALAAHRVAKWLGHSPLVAAKHSLQTPDAHLRVAVRAGGRSGAVGIPHPRDRLTHGASIPATR